MQVLYNSDTGTFYSTWYDYTGTLYDPDDITVRVTRNFSDSVYGPYVYSEGDVTRLGTGQYSISIAIDAFLVPSNYTVVWNATVSGDTIQQTEVFQLAEPDVESNSLIDPPRVYGKINQSHRYDVMGIGLTDTIFLVGHGDGIGINSPFQVTNVKEAINALGGDIGCPLIKALLEAYNAGARDIWLVAAAPMSEYIPFNGTDRTDRLEQQDIWGGLNWYGRYRERLRVTYTTLMDYENIEILVPVEAAYHDTDGVDFFEDLIWNCYDRFTNTGFVSIGLLGTQMGGWTEDDLEEMKNTPLVLSLGGFTRQDFLDHVADLTGDPAAYGDPVDFDSPFTTYDGFDINFPTREDEAADSLPYKFGMIIFGEATFTLPQSPLTYTNSVVSAAAGILSAQPLNRGLTYLTIPNAVNPVGKDLSYEQIQELAQCRINSTVRRQKGKRGQPYNTVIATDNLFSAEGSDFWSVVSMRMVGRVIHEIKLLGNKVIGTIQYGTFKRQVEEMLQLLVVNGHIRGYSLDISRRPPQLDPEQTVVVTLSLTPYFGVRELFFTVEVGPGA